MNKDPNVFSQLVQFMDRNHFNYLVRKYEGDKYVKSFTCWNQLLTIIFGQLTNRESLRDLIVATEAHSSKLYHPGMGKSVSRSNLSKANELRDYSMYQTFKCRLKLAPFVVLKMSLYVPVNVPVKEYEGKLTVKCQ